MRAYYNDNDKPKCAWVRELIRAGAITPGQVDDRSIEHVRADDVMGYDRVHLCAGAGCWDYALTLAGWDRPCWTASFPCPSFSAAGKAQGFRDPRHLWPVGFELIRQCRPAVLFMEQVGSAIGYGWFDLVAACLERENYALGAAVLASASVGAPCLRERLYIVAVDSEARCERPARQHRSGSSLLRSRSSQCSDTGKLDSAHKEGLLPEQTPRVHEERACGDDSARWSNIGELDSAVCAGLEGFGGDVDDLDQSRWDDEDAARSPAEADTADELEAKGQQGLFGDGNAWTAPTKGFWGDADWLFCTDGRWRAVEPGTVTLAARTPSRMVRLRGYGDAVNVEVAAAFIAASKEAIDSLIPKEN